MACDIFVNLVHCMVYQGFYWTWHSNVKWNTLLHVIKEAQFLTRTKLTWTYLSANAQKYAFGWSLINVNWKSKRWRGYKRLLLFSDKQISYFEDSLLVLYYIFKIFFFSIKKWSNINKATLAFLNKQGFYRIVYVLADKD